MNFLLFFRIFQNLDQGKCLDGLLDEQLMERKRGKIDE
jgi:hypothetical protein